MTGDTAATVRDAVASHEREIVGLTTRLVSLASENPPGRHYRECAETLAEALGELDLAPRMVETSIAGVDGPRWCVQGSTGGSGPCLYLHGHYDVVPAQSAEQFEPVVEDGRVRGRGSADMKGGLAAMLYAVAALRDLGAELDGQVCFNFVPDEETGGRGGSRVLSERGQLAPNGLGMLTPEPTGGVVWNANRGALTLELTVHGREAHVGHAHAGVNAFERMLEVAGALRELAAEVGHRATAYAIEPEAARGSILLIGGRSESGSGFNVVPARCTFTVDRRPNPEESLEEERERLLATLAPFRERGYEIDVEVLQEGDAAGSSEQDPLAVALAASVAEVEGAPPRFELCPGLLETRWYAGAGVPAFAYGPGRLDVSHGPDEHVEIDALLRCATVYALTIRRLLSS
jgi:acetylornithine deacetylase/succinyl-diaminopimelate desuccinylase family protein